MENKERRAGKISSVSLKNPRQLQKAVEGNGREMF